MSLLADSFLETFGLSSHSFLSGSHPRKHSNSSTVTPRTSSSMEHFGLAIVGAGKMHPNDSSFIFYKDRRHTWLGHA